MTSRSLALCFAFSALVMTGCSVDISVDTGDTEESDSSGGSGTEGATDDSVGDGDAGDGDGTSGDGTSGDGDGTTGDGDGTGGDGDGDGTGGDGDGTSGDGTSGDGTSGDGDGTGGDGDGTSGDGDGTSGDGDGTSGDGDGTSGDGDGTSGDGDGTSGDGDGTSGDGDGTSGDGDGTSGDGDGTSGDGDGTSGDGDGTSGDGDGCMAWEIEYELEGSVFEIEGTTLGAGDQVNTVQMPYDADDTVGPGRFVLTFEDVGGSPGGLVAMNEYQMSMHFRVVAFGATVQTDLENDAGPDACGVTTGNLAGDTVAWNPMAIVGHHSVGQILCNGAFCGSGGLPDGTPVPVDEITDQPVADFVFSAGLDTFTAAKTVVQMDSNSTSSWTYAGTEVSRVLVPADSCMCP